MYFGLGEMGGISSLQKFIKNAHYYHLELSLIHI